MIQSNTSGERRRLMRCYLENEELWCRCCDRPMWFYGLESRSRFVGRWQLSWGIFREPTSAEIEQSIATVDHLIPQCRNGTHHPRNLMLMCQVCNSDKAHMTPSEWIAHRAATGRALKKESIAKLLKRERKAIRRLGGPPMINHQATKEKPMADDKTMPGSDDDKTDPAIDMMQPVFIVLHQTEKRNNVEVFQGPDADANAKARAGQKAVRTKGSVAVLGPQRAVYEPLEPSKAKEVHLDWLSE